MKRFLAPMLIGATLATAASAADDSLKAEIAALKVQMAELKEAQSKFNYDALKKQISEVKAHSAGDNIKFSVDFRTAYDVVDYKIKGSNENISNNIWTNKLILNMAAQPVDNLVFKGSLAAYKTFGQNSMASTSSFQDFDWYATQKPTGSGIKLREAYFLYFGQMGDMPYTASFGRRPSVDGFLVNLREDNDHAASPVGHNINMEFDGASFKFDFDKLTGVSGLYFKLCIGRGFSNAYGSYGDNGAGGFANAYSKDSLNPSMDLVGLLAQLYDDGQYKVMANYFQGYNMMGANMAYKTVGYVGGNPAAPVVAGGMQGFVDVGDMSGASLSIQINGIGDEWSDFLDDTIFFASYAYSKTKPNQTPYGTIASNGVPGSDTGMLGSKNSEKGDSYYVGLNIPGFMEADRFGLEYNHGSKYWRSYTYGEDTMIGSKLATRGSAYEVYYNLPLINKNLTAQFRYTYIDYDYTGSDMFFGQTGTPMDVDKTPGAVESASDIRLSLRYRY